MKRSPPCSHPVSVALVLLLSAAPGALLLGQESPFRRGDANQDQRLNITDPVHTLQFLFLGTPERLTCEDAADNDDDGRLTLTDAVHFLNFLFRGGPEPRPPFLECGSDPTADALTCGSFAGCDADPSPVAAILEPAAGSIVSAPRPRIVGTVRAAAGSSIDPGSVVLTLDRVPVVPSTTFPDPETMRVELVPAAPLAEGPHEVTLSGSDQAGNASQVEVSTFIVCSNLPPSIAPIGDRTLTIGTALSFTVLSTDPEGDPVVLDASPLPLPRNAKFDSRTGLFVFAPDATQVGSFSLTFSARDGFCGSDTESVAITVNASATGRTSLTGEVVTNGLAPLQGVRLVLDGKEAFSGADGTFFLDSLPSGRQRLLIDGSTVPAARGTFATVPEMIELIDRGANILDAPIVLLPLDAASADPIDPARDSMITSSPIRVGRETFPAVMLRVPAGTARSEDTGQLFSGMVHISAIPSPDLGPRPLPADMDLSVYIAVQPFGVAYDPPAEISFPNIEKFAVGTIVDIFGLNHDNGQMEKVGEGRTGNDGMVHSIGGVVKSNSWHGFVPQPPIGGPDPCDAPPPPDDWDDEPAGSSSVQPRTGDLTVEHDLVGYRSLRTLRSLRLEYHSTTAFPAPLVSALVTAGNLSPPPDFMATDVSMAGIEQGRVVLEGPPICPVNCPFMRHPRIIDARAFPTGTYSAAITVQCLFPVSRRSRTFPLNMIVVNNSRSPYGSGWGIKGLKRIHKTATGEILMTNGDDSAIVYSPAVRAAAQVQRSGERDFYHFAARRGDIVTLRLNRRTNQGDGTGTLDPVLEVYTSEGLLVARDDDAGLDIPPGPGRNALLGALTLPATDTYTVVAAGKGGSRGPYHLFLTASSESFLVQGRIEPPRPMSPSFVFTGDLVEQSEAVHTFAAGTGTRVTISARRVANQAGGTGSLDPQVELRSSAGTLIARDDDTGTNEPPGPGRNALIPGLPLPATDTYSVAVKGSGNTRGPYELTVTFNDLSGTVENPEMGPVTIEETVISPPWDASTFLIHEDGSYTRRLKNGTRIEFDVSGLQTAVIDRNDNTTTYRYDAGGRLIERSDPVGLVSRLEYSASGLLEEIVDPMGRVTRFEHDAAGNLTAIMDPDGSTRHFTYDLRHLMLTQRNQRDLLTRYEYDFSGRFARTVLPDGSERTLLAAQSIGLVDPASGQGTMQNPAPFVLADRVEAELRIGEDSLRMLKVTGDTGRVSRVSDAAGVVMDVDRDEVGQRTRIQKPNGIDLSYTYDDQGNLRSQSDGVLDSTWSYTFDSEFNRVTSMTDPLGDTATVEYDERGNPVLFTSHAGRVATAGYDSRGHLTSYTNFLGTLTEYRYNTRGNLMEIASGTGAGRRVRSFSHTPEGYIAGITDPEGRTARFDYDLMGRLTRITLPDSRVITMTHDPRGNLETLTPPGSPAHTFSYNPAGLVESYTAPDVGPALAERTQYAYDAARRLRRLTHSDGETIDFELDPAGRLAVITTSLGEVRFEYDARTRRLNSIASPGGVTLSYAYMGGLPAEEVWEGEVAGRVARGYDLHGRIASHSVNGAAINYEYDPDGGIIQAGELILVRNSASGLLEGTTLEILTDSHETNAFGELTSYSAAARSAPIYSVEYTRDRMGRILEKLETVLGSTRRLAYSYGPGRQLGAVRENGVVIADYTYDANGNRRTVTEAGGTVSSTHDAQDRLVRAGSTSYSYNGAGQLITRDAGGQITRLTYDLLGNLLAVRLPDGRNVEYLSDGRDRRILKRLNGTKVRAWLYQDGLNPIAELDGSSRVTSRFIYATNAFCPDYMVKAGVAYRFITDQLGSPRLVVNAATGAVAQRMDYDAFGRVLQDTSPGFQPFGFAGGLHDPDTGLVRFGARDYDPETGRWLAKDPSLFSSGDSNLYAYAVNDPVNLADLTGHHYTLAGQFTANGQPLPVNPVSGTPIVPAKPEWGVRSGPLTPIKPGDPDFGEGVEPPVIDPSDPFDPARGAYPGRRSNFDVHPEDGNGRPQQFYHDERTGETTPLPDPAGDGDDDGDGEGDGDGDGSGDGDGDGSDDGGGGPSPGDC